MPDLSNGDVMYTPVKLSFFSSSHPPSLINQPSMLNKSSSAPVSIGLSAPPPALPRFPSTRRPRHHRVCLRAARYHGERQGCKGREATAEYGEGREHVFQATPTPCPVSHIGCHSVSWGRTQSLQPTCPWVGDAAEGEAWPHVGGRECMDVGVSGGEALGEALSWDWRVRVEREACGLDVGR